MADECTDVTTIEELSIFCRWVEDGQPVKHFLEIVPLKDTTAKTISSALIKFMKDKHVRISKLVGMRFAGAATSSGKHNGVQSLLKKNSPHAVFVHFPCHLLQRACVQAANATGGIKHVYVTLTTLWKIFHYSPKRTECQWGAGIHVHVCMYTSAGCHPWNGNNHEHTTTMNTQLVYMKLQPGDTMSLCCCTHRQEYACTVDQSSGTACLYTTKRVYTQCDDLEYTFWDVFM